MAAVPPAPTMSSPPSIARSAHPAPSPIAVSVPRLPLALPPLDAVRAPRREAPIGVFDSGIGGLSVLQALRQELPGEDFVYLADSDQAPYGERGDDFVAARSLALAGHLLRRHGIKALVVACNTATAAAIHLLRQRHPALPVIGVEPALKPALAASRTRRIGVAATRGTLASDKFRRLLAGLSDQAEFVLQPCPGLALALEESAAIGPGDAGALASSRLAISALIERHLSEMGRFGAGPGQIDTLVLGCTHYPFARRDFQARAGGQVQLLETGAPVARQTRRLLEARELLRLARPGAGTLALLSTARPEALRMAAVRWLQLPPACTAALASVEAG